MKVWQARLYMAAVAFRMCGVAWVLTRAPQWDTAPTFEYLFEYVGRLTWAAILCMAGALLVVAAALATEWALRASLALAAGVSAVWATAFLAADLIAAQPSLALFLFTSFVMSDLIVAGIPVFRHPIGTRSLA